VCMVWICLVMAVYLRLLVDDEDVDGLSVVGFCGMMAIAALVVDESFGF